MSVFWIDGETGIRPFAREARGISASIRPSLAQKYKAARPQLKREPTPRAFSLLMQERARRNSRAVRAGQGCGAFGSSRSSTSNTSVALGGIGPRPRSP